MHTEEKQKPLNPALSPHEGERENLSLVFESSIGLDFRMLPGPGRNKY